MSLLPEQPPNTTHSAIRTSELTAQNLRPTVQGKFISVNGEKFYVRGVTYGTFRPDADGNENFKPDVVANDFAMMKAAGINSVRTYTVPPRWLLDCAHQHGLYVMVGLPWEQHVAFLDDAGRANDIELRIRTAVQSCAGHPAILCFTIGNEIPTGIVRWLGAKRVTSFLRRLYRAVKHEDPAALVTYVNYPSTEYLDLPFVDFFCFNVYLEAENKLDAYLARLQNLAGDRPLVMAEIGLDSRRNGVERQATTLAWQVRRAFAAGCAGAFVFAWTDEWWRGGFDIEDWDFGMVTRNRTAKPALKAVSRAFAEVPFRKDVAWPSISVVVCTYNGSRTIRDCMEGLQRLNYPNFEVIVVNDGSTDNTAEIVNEYDFTLISTENRGLSSARNTGLVAAKGDIVAYTDDDARPDPHWLQYLAHTFITEDFAGVGGPNIAPAGDGWIADCVANSPGGPVHVLLSDREAEHIPGCNMSFRRDALMEVGGCDPIYRVAGDDVDLCWRLQRNGGVLGFSPAAMVWHHRRNSVRMYWRQQQGYGKAEALLESKWPEKYNTAGHLSWAGRLYGKGLTQALFLTRRIYHGEWGAAPFQSIHERPPGFLASLPLMPEWYLVIALLATLSLLSLVWSPLLLAIPLLLLAVGMLAAQALRSASNAQFTSSQTTRLERFRTWSLTAAFHALQPLARLRGRIRWGLTPWRRRGVSGVTIPRPRHISLWSERWQSVEDRLQRLEDILKRAGACVVRGGSFDSWDLTVRVGIFGCARLITVVEEHGAGKQLARLKVRPAWSSTAFIPTLLFAVLAIVAATDGVLLVATVLMFVALIFTIAAVAESGLATNIFLRAVSSYRENELENTTEEPEVKSAPSEQLEIPVVVEPMVARAGAGASSLTVSGAHPIGTTPVAARSSFDGNGNGNGNGNGRGNDKGNGKGNGKGTGSANGRNPNGHIGTTGDSALSGT